MKYVRPELFELAMMAVSRAAQQVYEDAENTVKNDHAWVVSAPHAVLAAIQATSSDTITYSPESAYFFQMATDDVRFPVKYPENYDVFDVGNKDATTQ